MRLNPLRWIARKDKSLVLPPVIFEQTTNCSGYYQFPEDKEILIGDHYYSLNHGIIVIHPDLDINDADLVNCLAHEWRHHWQFYKFGFLPGSTFQVNETYEKAIKDFFRSDPLEMDALIFSHKYAPSPVSQYWMDLLMHKQE